MEVAPGLARKRKRFQRQHSLRNNLAGANMNTYKIEITLELNEQCDLEWVFQAVRELLEDGETIQTGRYKQIETESV